MEAASPVTGPFLSPEQIDRLYVEAIERRAQVERLSEELKDRAATLQAAQGELQRSHTVLLELTLTLDSRMVQQTVALTRTVEVLRQQSTQLRALASELTLAEQRERLRMAEVLHGDLQQLLVGARLRLRPFEQATDPALREAGREVSDLLQQALQCSRSLIEELHPPYLRQGDLVAALEWLARWMERRHRFAVVLRSDGTLQAQRPETAILLFESIRELLLNAVKHANVQTADVEVRQREGQIRIIVSDAGAGFDPTQLRVAGGIAGGFGLFGIRERLELLGGGLRVESAPAKGSRFTIWLPLQPAGPTRGISPVPAAGG